MYLSVQLSCYPLKEEYKQPIKDLIARLEQTGLVFVAKIMEGDRRPK